MNIIFRKEFLKYPEGTLFYRVYNDMVQSRLCVKYNYHDETDNERFYYKELGCYFLDKDSMQTDSCYEYYGDNSDVKYFVLDKDDVERLIFYTHKFLSILEEKYDSNKEI